MKKIPLTQGLYAIVDDEDFDELSKYKWHAERKLSKYYAVRHGKAGVDPTTKVKMHRHVMMLSNPKVSCDHINGDTLDNRRSNLRACSQSQNLMNRAAPKSNTSGYKGVYFTEKTLKYKASITIQQKQIHIGFFDSPIEAAMAYDEVAKRFHGEFARLNFPNELFHKTK